MSFPDVRGDLTCGADRSDALEIAEDALTIILYPHIGCGEPIPMPVPGLDGQDSIPLTEVVSAKMALDLALCPVRASRNLTWRGGSDVMEVGELLNLQGASPAALVDDAIASAGQPSVVERSSLGVRTTYRHSLL